MEDVRKDKIKDLYELCTVLFVSFVIYYHKVYKHAHPTLCIKIYTVLCIMFNIAHKNSIST